MNPLSPAANALFAAANFACVAGTAVLPWLAPGLHPWAATVASPVAIALNILWARGDSGLDPGFGPRRSLLIIAIALALMTGVAANMGFLPSAFHRIAVWPLVALAAWDFFKGLLMIAE